MWANQHLCPLPARSADSGCELSALFDSLYEASGLPMLMLAPDGTVLGASDDNRLHLLVSEDAARDGRLHDRLHLYLSMLGGPSPWRTPKQIEMSRTLASGETVRERISLRLTSWGACLSVLDLGGERSPAPIDLQTARLAALGFMVAGVCHEITNPLTSLHSIVQILRSEQPPSPELLQRGLDNIAINVNRILEISRRLAKFSRVGDEPRERLMIDQIVDEALRELGQQGTLRGIELVHTPCAEGTVNGNAGELRQVFLNLFRNAAQAMGGQGRLCIETQRIGRMTEVHVSDNGPGVPDAVAGRIFEPFFTTHSDTHGTGLGLPLSAEIALEHGGGIDLRHSSVAGASFCVALPHGG